MSKKKDAAKKGAPVGNYKMGKQMKEILPPNSKLPRESIPCKPDGEPCPVREFEYEPFELFPEWPGNDQAIAHDYTVGCSKDENGVLVPFTDET